jgi:2-oxo-3-hexenedioate decarboxylase
VNIQLANAQLQLLAEFLNSAELERKEVTRITAEYPDLTVENAYEIQDELVKLKLSAGNTIVGPKMGLTSKAKMNQMNVKEPIYGYVFDYMKVSNGGTVSVSELIHPKVEAELAFILKKDIEGENPSIEEILEATEFIVPALEIIDSRYENFKFTLPDVIADNTSASRVVFGDHLKRPNDIPVELIGATIAINGEIKAVGTSCAVLGHPAASIAMLTGMLYRKGKKLKAGEIILSGAITEAVRFSAGEYISVKFDGLGEVTFSAVE